MIITQCCVCFKIKLSGEWVKNPYQDKNEKITYSHGYCPKCREKWLKQELGDDYDINT